MLKIRSSWCIQQRWKGGKSRWITKRQTNTERALENFDNFYSTVFGIRWKNLRAALLTEHKYVAMVNNFGDVEQTCSQLEMDGAINIKSLVNLAKERLGDSQSFAANKYSQSIDNKMGAITQIQREKEIQSLYPESESVLPTELEYKSKEMSNSNDISVGIDDKAVMSMGKALESDVCIDQSRLIDPEGKTGAFFDFVPASQIKGMEDWIPESEHYKYYQTTTDFPLNVEPENDFLFPDHLSLYTYEMGNCSRFKRPKSCVTGVLSHYLLDGASILPPLLLDVKPGERVLDACAAPGGKSLLMLQTLHPEQLVCNDVEVSRVNRIREVMKEYIFDYQEVWEGQRIILNHSDARCIGDYGTYDKILVDVPCTTDRHSLMENDNNIFKPIRVHERLRMPELQSGILENCLRLLRPGGSLVYSTCSLSPVQNDGVVHMALQKLFTEHCLTFTIKDLSNVINLFSDIYKFEYPKNLKYGQLILPYLPANFGPMYMSKITRNL